VDNNYILLIMMKVFESALKFAGKPVYLFSAFGKFANP